MPLTLNGEALRRADDVLLVNVPYCIWSLIKETPLYKIKHVVVVVDGPRLYQKGISKILLLFERDNLDIMAEAPVELPDVIGL